MTDAADPPGDAHILLPGAGIPTTEMRPLREFGRPVGHQSTGAHDALIICQSLLSAGDLEAAARALEAAKRRGLAANVAVATEATLCWLKGEWPALRRLSERVIANCTQPSAGDYLALATACRHLDDVGGALRAATQAVALNPAQIDAAFILAWAAAHSGDGEAMLNCYRDLARIDPNNVRWMIEVVRVLQHLGRPKDAAAEMERALERAPTSSVLWGWALGYGYRTVPQAEGAGLPAEVAESVVGGFRLRDLAPEDAALARPVMADVFGSDVIVAPARDADMLVLVFTGGSDSLSMPLPVFDRYLAALGVSAVYLKDFRRLLYLNGIASLGDDLKSTITALRQLQHRLGAKRLCTMGDSDGGYAAIRYAVELDAECALSFAGPTRWLPGAGEFALFQNRLKANFSEEAMDLKSLLAYRHECAKVMLYFGSEEARDGSHARHLSGTSRVELHPIAGQGSHNIIQRLAMHHELLEILGRSIGVLPHAAGVSDVWC